MKTLRTLTVTGDRRYSNHAECRIILTGTLLCFRPRCRGALKYVSCYFGSWTPVKLGHKIFIRFLSVSHFSEAFESMSFFVSHLAYPPPLWKRDVILQ